jgi:hypothetical protein
VFSNTDSPYTEQGDRVKSRADGMFTITREFSVEELANEGQNIRIKIAETVDFDIYEITIVDEMAQRFSKCLRTKKFKLCVFRRLFYNRC